MKDNGIYHGSRVRVFDFAAGMYGRDLGGPMAFYVEGVVSAFDYDGLERVVVVVTKDVQAGKETNERLGKVVKPVNNGVEDQYGRTVNVIDIMPDDSEPIEECKPIGTISDAWRNLHIPSHLLPHLPKPIAVGEYVRVYDFLGDTECYVEGEITGYEVIHGSWRYKVQIENDVFAGRVQKSKPSDGQYVYPPVLGVREKTDSSCMWHTTVMPATRSEAQC